MSLKTDGSIFIFSSPSGAGKTTLVDLFSKKQNFTISVSHTTRNPRSNEIEGKDYYFVSQEKFENMIKQNEFLEFARVFNNLYGTTKTPVFQNLENGKNVLFDIDWQGSKQIKAKDIKFEIFSFFVLPPSREVLQKRLSNRDMKDKLIVEERMQQFERDVLHWINYDYVVINDDLNNCYMKIKSLIDAEIKNGSKDYDSNYIRNHIEKLTS